MNFGNLKPHFDVEGTCKHYHQKNLTNQKDEVIHLYIKAKFPIEDGRWKENFLFSKNET